MEDCKYFLRIFEYFEANFGNMEIYKHEKINIAYHK